MTDVLKKYEARMDALSVCERMQRANALFNWSREIVARQILAERGPMSSERLKWEVALRQYGSDPTAKRMIERMLASVSD